MIQKEFYVQLQVKQQIPKNVGAVVQNDINGNRFMVSLVDGVNPVDITGYTTITFTVLKPDNTYYVDSIGDRIVVIDPKRGELSIILGTQAVTKPGLCQAVIEVWQNNIRITSAKLIYLVIPDISYGADPTSESDYPALLSLMSQLSSAEGLRLTAEDGRVLAETGRVNAELARVTAENQREIRMTQLEAEADQRLDAIEAVATNNENIRQSQEVTRQSQESVRQKNELIRQNSIADIENRWYTLTAEQQQDAEVIDARRGKTSLGEKIDDIDSQLADNAINVKQFGAKGDGVTDDTIAIQNAINYIAQRNGGIAYMPNGTYLVSSSLIMYSKVKLQGSSYKLVEIRDHANLGQNPIILAQGTLEQRLNNITIEGIKIRNGSASTGSYSGDKNGIYALYVDDITIKRCMITEIEGRFGFAPRRCTDINILENVFYRCTYSACSILEECENVKVLDNTIDTLTSLTAPNTYTITTGYDGATGVVQFPVKNMWVERNIIKNNPRWEGIDSHGVQNMWIRENYVENCRIAVMVGSADERCIERQSKNIFIENNIFIQGDGEIDHHGIYVGGKIEYPIENAIIKGNEIIGFGASNTGSITMDFIKNGEVSFNKINKYRYIGIRIGPGNNDIKINNNYLGDIEVKNANKYGGGILISDHGNVNISIENNISRPSSNEKSPYYFIYSSPKYNNIKLKNNIFTGDTIKYLGMSLANFQPNVSLPAIALFYMCKGDVLYDINENPLYFVTGPEKGHSGNRPLNKYVFSGVSGSNILTLDTYVPGATLTYGIGCNVTVPISTGTLSAIIIALGNDYIKIDKPLPEDITSEEVTNAVATWVRAPLPIVKLSAPPTTGTYERGDIVYNTNPTAGGYLGWICTAAGTPGTWKGFGLIET